MDYLHCEECGGRMTPQEHQEAIDFGSTGYAITETTYRCQTCGAEEVTERSDI